MDKLYCHLNDVDWWLPRDTLHRSLPQSSRETFPKKTCIIDATVLFTVIQIGCAISFLLQIQTPPHCESISCNIAMWSCYVCVTTIYWCHNGDLRSSLVFSINLCLEIKSWQTKDLLLLTFSWTLGISCATSFSKRRRSVY